jgi:hypothetical protein
MKLRSIFHFFCLGLTVAIAPKSVSAGVELTQGEIERLARGELVVQPLSNSRQDSVVAGISYALINAPPDRVWAALQDIPSWPSIFPNTFEARTVAVQGDARAARISLGNRFVTFNFYLTVTFNKDKWETFFVLNKKKPHDIRECRGFARLVPQPGGRTLVVFSSLAEFPFAGLIGLMGPKVIGWIEHRVLSVPERLKKWVEGP